MYPNEAQWSQNQAAGCAWAMLLKYLLVQFLSRCGKMAKSSASLKAVVSVGVLLFSTFGLAATEVVSREVLIDNPTVEVVRLKYPAGSESGMHSHAYPHRVAYVVQGGVLELVPADSEVPSRSLEVKEGQAIFLPAAKHNVRNIGETEIIIIETEIK